MQFDRMAVDAGKNFYRKCFISIKKEKTTENNG